MNTLLAALGAAFSSAISAVSLAVLAVRVWLLVNLSSLRTLAPRILLSVLTVGAFALGDGFERVVWLHEHTGVAGLVAALLLAVVATLIALDGVAQLLGKFRRY